MDWSKLLHTNIFDLPGFRNSIIFDGYAEGWALYAEYIASEMGWYEDDPYGDLGRLQYEALRAARMFADTGIHIYGWTQAETSRFLLENTGITKGHTDLADRESQNWICIL